MSTRGVLFRTAVGLAAGSLGAVSMFPGVMPAQAGAIGAGVSGVLVGEGVYQNAPIFINSALVLGQGRWSVGGAFVLLGGLDSPVSTQRLYRGGVSAFYGVGDRLTLGVSALPFNSLTVEFDAGGSRDTSGFGDVFLEPRYQFWRSQEGSTKLLAVGRVGFPTARAPFGRNGLTFEPGVIATHQVRNLTLNAGTSVLLPTDDQDATVLSMGAAVVLGVRRSLGLSLEVFGDIGEGDTERLAIGPGARLRVSQHFFVDAAIAVIAARSVSSTEDYILLLGLAYAR